MLGGFIRLVFRNLKKNLLYTGIVVGGLVVGIITFLSIIQWTAWHMSYDQHFPESDQIYRFSINEHRENFERHTARILHGDIVHQLHANSQISEIVSVARIAPYRNAIVSKEAIVFYENRTYACDPEFLALFPPEMVMGDATSALNHPYNVILSEETARKYFGEENPVGKTIEIVHQFGVVAEEYEITGIFRKYPENTHFDIDLLTSFDAPETYNGTAWTYLKLIPGAVVPEVEKGITTLINENNDADYARGLEPVLIPLADIHLKSHLAREMDQNVHQLTLLILFIAGMLVFLLAWFNFTLLSVSQNQLNLKKLIYQWQAGSGKRNFFTQFFTEFMVVGTIAYLLAIGFSLVLSDPIRSTFHVPVSQNPHLFIFSLLAILLVLILSSAITATYTTRRLFRILKIRYFAGNTNTRRNLNSRDWFIRAVIIIEFIITFVLMTNLMMIREQVHFSIANQIGSNDSTTLQIPNLPRPVVDQYSVFREELIKFPVIEEITAMMEEPGGMAMDAFPYQIEGLPETEDRLFVFPVDENFTRFYDLEILAGNDFPAHYNTEDTTEFYMLNETAARRLSPGDYENLIGREITMDFSAAGYIYPGKITGVVEDFHLSDMEREISPMIIFPEYTWLYCFSIRFAGDAETGLQKLSEVWQKLYPDYPLRYFFTTDIFRELYATEYTILRVLMVFSLLTLIIAGTGLFALSGFFMQRKMHGAAIRKIHGASMFRIIRPELGQYLWLAILSSAIAIPLSWFAIERWQENFVYQAGVPIWIFPVISFFLVLFSWIAVIYHSVRLARLNPTEFIKSD